MHMAQRLDTWRASRTRASSLPCFLGKEAAELDNRSTRVLKNKVTWRAILEASVGGQVRNDHV